MAQTTGNCLTCICCFPCLLFFLALSLGVPALMMYLGVTGINACPVEPRIPIWMIVIASLIFLQILLESIRPLRAGSMKNVDCTIDCCSFLSLVLYTSRIALFAATVFGCVLVFLRVPVQNQCDYLLYCSSFIYCILALVSYAIAILFCTCCCVCAFLGGYQGVSTEPENRYN